MECVEVDDLNGMVLLSPLCLCLSLKAFSKDPL